MNASRFLNLAAILSLDLESQYMGKNFLEGYSSKRCLFFSSLTLHCSNMVHCGDPIFSPCCLDSPATARKCFAWNPNFWWRHNIGVWLNVYLGLNADLVYLKIFPRPQALHQGFWSKTGHVLAVAGESKPGTEGLGLCSATCWSDEVTGMKRKDTFWKKVPPGKFDPYGSQQARRILCKKVVTFSS